jgi:hypothetical protein
MFQLDNYFYNSSALNIDRVVITFAIISLYSTILVAGEGSLPEYLSPRLRETSHALSYYARYKNAIYNLH